jgi:hypothetical protein
VAHDPPAAIRENVMASAEHDTDSGPDRAARFWDELYSSREVP